MSPEHVAPGRRAVILFTIAIVSMVLLVVGGAWFAIVVATHTAMSQQQKWCDTLDILTSQPLPPHATASTRQLYADFTELKRDFKCQ